MTDHSRVEFSFSIRGTGAVDYPKGLSRATGTALDMLIAVAKGLVAAGALSVEDALDWFKIPAPPRPSPAVEPVPAGAEPAPAPPPPGAALAQDAPPGGHEISIGTRVNVVALPGQALDPEAVAAAMRKRFTASASTRQDKALAFRQPCPAETQNGSTAGEGDSAPRAGTRAAEPPKRPRNPYEFTDMVREAWACLVNKGHKSVREICSMNWMCTDGVMRPPNNQTVRKWVREYAPAVAAEIKAAKEAKT